jgi:hypothetical protein
VASPLEGVVFKIVFSCVLPKAGLARHRGWQEVVWRDFFCVDAGGSRLLGAAGPRWRTCDNERAQDGGTVWRRSGVDGGPGERLHINLTS